MHHAEDQREADAEQRVGRAEQHAVDHGLNGVDQIEIDPRCCPDGVGIWTRALAAGRSGPPPAQFDVRHASGRRLVQDQPACRPWRARYRNGLIASRSRRAPDLPSRPLVSFSAARPSRILTRSACHRVGLRHDLLALDHVLEDEHDLVGGGAVQVGAAPNFATLSRRLGRLRGHRRKARRDDQPLGLLGAALQRLEAGGTT